MKIFNRTSLPETLKYNNKTYVYSVEKTFNCIREMYYLEN